MEHKFGWLPQLNDNRDKVLNFSPNVRLASLPPVVDMRPKCPPVWDQGQLGSCTAQGVGFLLEYEQIVQGLDSWIPSRLGIYYCTRILELTTNYDAGAMIRDVIKAVAKWGFCPETIWPYDINKFKQNPGHTYFGSCWHHNIIEYAALNKTLNDMKICLAQGKPFTFGFTVYESFESDYTAQTGIMTMPQPGESPIGGHCVTAVGWKDATQQMICRNSWSDGWGDKGYFYMPYSFILGADASDFWVVSKVSNR